MSVVDDTKTEARRRHGLVTFTSLYTFLVLGAFFGWGPMQLMLEDNGNFASKCTPEEQDSGIICPEQSAALVNVHFFGVVSQILSPILGILADRYGSVRLAYAMMACAWIGVGLLIVATHFVIDALLYPRLHSLWTLYVARGHFEPACGALFHGPHAIACHFWHEQSL